MLWCYYVVSERPLGSGTLLVGELVCWICLSVVLIKCLGNYIKHNE